MIPEPNKKWCKKAKEIWVKLNKEFIFDDYRLSLLTEAMEILNTIEKYKRIVAKEGDMIRTERSSKAHLLIKAIDNKHTQFLRYMRALNCDVEETSNKIGRPGART